MLRAELDRLPKYRKYNPKLVDMLIAQIRVRILRFEHRRIFSKP